MNCCASTFARVEEAVVDCVQVSTSVRKSLDALHIHDSHIAPLALRFVEEGRLTIF
jgi:hypothetical protein